MYTLVFMLDRIKIKSLKREIIKAKIKSLINLLLHADNNNKSLKLEKDYILARINDKGNYEIIKPFAGKDIICKQIFEKQYKQLTYDSQHNDLIYQKYYKR